MSEALDEPIPGLPPPTTETVIGSALLSEDKHYLYTLTRRWEGGYTPVTFVMLHPTHADAATDDPTIRRCVEITHRLGGTQMVLVNLYAYRADRRDALLAFEDPVGPDNDRHLQRALGLAKILDAPLIAAWGSHARRSRVEQVMDLPGAERFTCLGVNADGSPVHPTHADPDADLIPWRLT